MHLYRSILVSVLISLSTTQAVHANAWGRAFGGLISIWKLTNESGELLEKYRAQSEQSRAEQRKYEALKQEVEALNNSFDREAKALAKILNKDLELKDSWLKQYLLFIGDMRDFRKKIHLLKHENRSYEQKIAESQELVKQYISEREELRKKIAQMQFVLAQKKVDQEVFVRGLPARERRVTKQANTLAKNVYTIRLSYTDNLISRLKEQARRNGSIFQPRSMIYYREGKKVVHKYTADATSIEYANEKHRELQEKQQELKERVSYVESVISSQRIQSANLGRKVNATNQKIAGWIASSNDLKSHVKYLEYDIEGIQDAVESMHSQLVKIEQRIAATGKSISISRREFIEAIKGLHPISRLSMR